MIEFLNLLGKDVYYYNILIGLIVKKLFLLSYIVNIGNYNYVLINELRDKFIGYIKINGI